MPVARASASPSRRCSRRSTTEQYPEEKKPTAPRYHGRHVLNRHPDGLEKCIGCELCAWACPADAIYVEGARQHRGRALLAGRALRPRLPDQLPALHLLRPVHRGLPDPRADDEQRVRAGRRQPARPDLRQGAAARPAAARHGGAAAPDGPGDDEKDYYRGGTQPCPAARRPRGGGRHRPTRAELCAAAPAPPARHSAHEAIIFWVVAPLAVLRRSAWCCSRKAVHAALLLAVVMLSWPSSTSSQDAPFLGVVQIVVYTGAIMMLFLFVLMLVGVDASDSLVETLRGQRFAAVAAGLGFASLLVVALGRRPLGSCQPRGSPGANARRRQRLAHRPSCSSPGTSSPSRSPPRC